MAENLPQIHVVDADATYLMWLDCSALTEDVYKRQEYMDDLGQSMYSS